jgi:hypothetical protein
MVQLSEQASGLCKTAFRQEMARGIIWISPRESWNGHQIVAELAKMRR